MSYCVNCGVELDASIKNCPLCNTPVLNPKDTYSNQAIPPFPEEKGQVDTVKHRDLAILLSTILIATAVGCGLLNLLVFKGSLWSLAIIGACVLIWVFAIPAVIYTKLSIYYSLLLDEIIIIAYLYSLTIMIGKNHWFFSLALPIVVLSSILVLLFVFLIHKFKVFFITTAIYFFAELGILCVGIELFIRFYLKRALGITWSAVVLTVCSIIVAIFVTVMAKKRLRNEVRRRLHF